MELYLSIFFQNPVDTTNEIRDIENIFYREEDNMIMTMTKLTHATGTTATGEQDMIQMGQLEPVTVFAVDCVSSSLSRNDSHSGQVF